MTNPTIDSLITTHEDLTTTGYVLAADTTYWLVLHRPWGSDNIRIDTSCDRLSTPEGVTTGEVGWSLGESLFLGLGSWEDARRLLMAVYQWLADRIARQHGDGLDRHHRDGAGRLTLTDHGRSRTKTMTDAVFA